MDQTTILILGTSHIAKQSVNQINEAFEKKNPDIVGVELDKGRYYSLSTKKRGHIQLKDIFKIGINGYFFLLIGSWAEKKMGKIVDITPGADMMNAIKLAKKKNLKIVMIDQEISITLKNLSKRITWKEKFNFFADILKGIFFRKQEIPFDLKSVPDEETIFQMIEKVKPRYPNIFRTLVSDRDKVMSNRLYLLAQQNPGKKILAVVGAGHKKGIRNILKRYQHPDKEYNRFDIELC